MGVDLLTYVPCTTSRFFPLVLFSMRMSISSTNSMTRIITTTAPNTPPTAPPIIGLVSEPVHNDSYDCILIK